MANAGIPADDIEIITLHDVNGEGCPKTLKRLVAMAQTDLVYFQHDDAEGQPGFLKEATEVMKTLSGGFGVVGLPDGFWDPWRCALHWLGSKRMLPLLGGAFFHVGYRHTCCDVELTYRSRLLRRFAVAEKAFVKHRSDYFIGKELDAVHDAAYRSLPEDTALLMHRSLLFRFNNLMNRESLGIQPIHFARLRNALNEVLEDLNMRKINWIPPAGKFPG
jgi:hypothetical protein